MGLTKRKDSYYVEFPVLDDGKVLTLARGVAGAKLRRWKVGCLNRTVAKQQEALIKTHLMKGRMQVITTGYSLQGVGIGVHRAGVRQASEVLQE